MKGGGGEDGGHYSFTCHVNYSELTGARGGGRGCSEKFEHKISKGGGSGGRGYWYHIQRFHSLITWGEANIIQLFQNRS